MGRPAEFPICHDGVLRGGRVVVWRILPFRVADGQAPRAAAPGDGRPAADVAIRGLCEGILPEFQIIALVAQFYTLYVVWEGSRVLLEVEDSRRLSFTLLSFVLLVGCPMLVEWVFNELTFLLN